MSQTFGPYSPVRQAGNYYYTAGQVGVDPVTKNAPTTITDQTKQVLENLKAVLADAGVDMDDVVKTTVYVTDMSTFAEVNAVYETYFAAPRPARSTVQVTALPNVADVPLAVEIEAVAYREVA